MNPYFTEGVFLELEKISALSKGRGKLSPMTILKEDTSNLFKNIGHSIYSPIKDVFGGAVKEFPGYFANSVFGNTFRFLGNTARKAGKSIENNIGNTMISSTQGNTPVKKPLEKTLVPRIEKPGARKPESIYDILGING